jgi:hypothetical protein
VIERRAERPDGPAGAFLNNLRWTSGSWSELANALM